ncbi:MAG TPA: hypothetical protein VHZ75_00900 [Solirubrobacteraceae bacterium]|jgi:hypothetical protein|nr:hypothetical protein [Solirubrobacteraceae bacterium]
MRRVSIASAAVVAALGGLALVVTTGSADSSMPAGLHLVSKEQKSVGFGPNHKPRQGETVGFGDAVSGDDSGTDRGICTVIGTGRNQAICTVVVRLSKGTITALGTVNFTGPGKNVPFAITGGTGAYDGASGTALVTDANASTTDLNISFHS